MAFHSSGDCADGWSGFGDGVGPGSFCCGTQDQRSAPIREQRQAGAEHYYYSAEPNPFD
jgi:hypothetical protein